VPPLPRAGHRRGRGSGAEIFQPDASEGETYPIVGDRIDLEPLVREAVLPALPLAPLCSAGCEGPVPEAWVGDEDPDLDEQGERPPDPRWAALDALKAPEADS
jgi:uncharacterized protein